MSEKSVTPAQEEFSIPTIYILHGAKPFLFLPETDGLPVLETIVTFFFFFILIFHSQEKICFFLIIFVKQPDSPLKILQKNAVQMSQYLHKSHK